MPSDEEPILDIDRRFSGATAATAPSIYGELTSGDALRRVDTPTQDFAEEQPIFQPPKTEEIIIGPGFGTRAEPTLEDCLSRLDIHITESKPDLGTKLFRGDIRKYGDAARAMITSLVKLGCDPRLAIEFSVLTLYDLVVFIGIDIQFVHFGWNKYLTIDKDDSTSMGSNTNKETLKKTLTEICDIYNLANHTGIKAVRYVNNLRGKKDVSTAADVEEVVNRCAHVGVSRIGTELHKRIIVDFVLKPVMVKPLLVIIIANGTVRYWNPSLDLGLVLNVLPHAAFWRKSKCFAGRDQ